MKKTLRLPLECLLYISCLTSFVTFFLKDQLDAFIKGRQTTSSRFEDGPDFDVPTITLCMNPGIKAMEGTRFGFEYQDDIFFQDDGFNSTLIERYNNVSYKLNEDYEVIIYDEIIREGINEVVAPWDNGSTCTIDAQPLRTYYFGTCYILFLQCKFVNNFDISMKVALNATLPKENIPGDLVLFFTSNLTWVGIPGNFWPQYKPAIAYLKFKRDVVNLSLRTIRYIFKEGQKNTSLCLKTLATNAGCKCHMLSSFDLPPCETVHDFLCIESNVPLSHELACYNVKEAITYEIDESRIKKFKSNNMSILIDIDMLSKQREVHEEVPVLSTSDLIGSVGGSLGMFFGFSFTATGLVILRRIFNHFHRAP